MCLIFIQVIMQSLSTSFDMFLNVLGFFAFFWVLFALFALLVFTNSFSRQCAVMPQGGIHKNSSGKLYIFLHSEQGMLI